MNHISKGVAFGILFSIPLWFVVACAVNKAISLSATNNIPAGVLLTPRAKVYSPTELSTCRPVHGANPWAYVPDQRPMAGKPIKCSFLSSYVAPRNSYPFMIAVSQQLLSPTLDLTPYGAPGCRLLIPLDQSFLLSAEGDVSGPFTYSAPGRVDFNMPTTSAFSGQKLYLQAGILTPGENQAGILTTQAVVFWIQ